MNGAHFSVGFPNVNLNHVEPRCRRAFPQSPNIRLCGAVKRPFLSCVHGKNGTVRVAFRARFDFDEDECLAVAGDDVYFVFPRSKIATENFHAALFFQKIGGEFFSGITAFPPRRFPSLRRIFPENSSESALKKINGGKEAVPNPGGDDLREKPPDATQQ